MEKENLDDLMREKFDTDDPGARFEFREEYWEQAQAMLEADERKRKRRFLWWWWMGAGCLLLAVGGWFGYAHSGGGDQPGTGQTTSLPKTGDTTNAQVDNELGGKQIDSLDKPANLENPAGGSLGGKSITAAGEPSGSKGERADLKNPAGRSLTRMPTTAAETPTRAGRKPLDAKSERTDLKNPAGRSLAGMPTTAAKTATGLPTENTGLPSVTPQPTGLPEGGTRIGNKNPADGSLVGTSTTAAKTAAGLPTGNTGLPSAAPQPTGLPVGNVGNTGNAGNVGNADNTGNNTSGTNTDAGNAGNTSHMSNATNVGILGVPPMPVLQKLPPIDFQTLATPPNIPFFPKAPQAAREIKPLREPRFSLGLGASASAFFPKNKAARLGGTAGIFADYRLSRSFSLNAGVAWRYVPMSGIVADSAHPSEVSEQLRYSFGYVKTQSSIRSEGLHTLELPLALRWHRGPWHLEGGASLSRLLGVQANLMEERSTSLQPLPVTTKKKIWTDDQPYRQMWVSPMLGAGWQRGRWSVSLRAVLFPLDVAPPLIPDEPRATGLRPNVDVGLRYRIF